MAKTEFDWMVGRTFTYEGKNITIAKIVKDTGEFKITSNKNTIAFVSASELKKDFAEVIEQKGGVPMVTHSTIQPINTDLDTLTSGLFDAFNKIKGEDGNKYIPQAAAMNVTAKNIIDVKRVQLDAIKLIAENRK